jgi:hypothetical protein
LVADEECESRIVFGLEKATTTVPVGTFPLETVAPTRSSLKLPATEVIVVDPVVIVTESVVPQIVPAQIQAPPEHFKLGPHTLPHDPQLALSTFVLMQIPLQATSSKPPQIQIPLEQICPFDTLHVFPIVPQLLGSLAKSGGQAAVDPVPPVIPPVGQQLSHAGVVLKFFKRM